MKPTINILFSCDTNYAMPMTVCITSIFENNKENQVDIYILYSTLSDQQKEILTNLAQTYSQKIHLIAVPDHYFSNAPTLRWTKETYYRLLINELLPKELERIIYLDCDTLVNRSLLNLYNFNLEEYYIAALEEDKNIEHRERLGLNKTGKYYQAGVLLFDLSKCRTKINYEEANSAIRFLGDKLVAVDQDIINFIFNGKIKKIDKKFNNCEVTNFENNNIKRFFNIINMKEVGESTILHFATNKPWNNLYSGSCEELWYKYLKISPYRYLYNQKYNSIKYKILRTGLFKTFFYWYIHITPLINNISKTLFPEKIYSELKRYYRKYVK
jgi:lipopolysaccharide biosynthesis glycosyltransferase